MVLFYRIGANIENVKNTYAVGAEVAELVRKDYASRFPTEPTVKMDTNDHDTDESVDFFYDAGGMRIGSIPSGSINVKTPDSPYVGFKLGFHADQVGLLIICLKAAEDRGGYTKLHGRWTCLCMSTELTKKVLFELGLIQMEMERVSEEAFLAWRIAHPNKPK